MGRTPMPARAVNAHEAGEYWQCDTCGEFIHPSEVEEDTATGCPSCDHILTAMDDGFGEEEEDED